jgi:hypothetical protein
LNAALSQPSTWSGLIQRSAGSAYCQAADLTSPSGGTITVTTTIGGNNRIALLVATFR